MQPQCRLIGLVIPFLALALFVGAASADRIEVGGSTGKAGIALRAQDPTGVTIHYEMGEFSMDGLTIDSEPYTKLSLSGVLLPNDAGAPDLPGFGRFIAIPQGARVRVEIVGARTQSYSGLSISPAPVIPKETDPADLVYRKNPALYDRDAYYPQQVVMLSAPTQMRGVDAVTMGITPFQYNPVTRELLVYTEIDLRIVFEGGNGRFGEERLRSRFWDPILAQHILNHESLPAVDFDAPRGDRNGFEYVIICPDNPEFIAWADTLKTWRQLQGITTEVFTTTEVGGTTSTAIENFLNNAYNTWNPAPDAFLLLGDFPGTGLLDSGITSPTWDGYCVSDNIYADVNGDDLPDMVHARITGRNGAELQTMISKMLSYERNPYTDPGFYERPLIAGGWQTERWFILCCEIIYGHQANALGKTPTREYAIYQGTPGTSWSSNPNTYMLVNYFGPSGLGYIPQTPQHLTDWGGNATRINNDLNAGAYLLLHRDHGEEVGWGEPAYGITNLSGLHNDKLPFVMSMNCLTGKYNWSSQSFTEAFHRMGQGAVGLIAASEISYSFVNDAYVFGIFDTMWPGFMPDYGPYPPASGFATDLKPAFGQVSGKYFLQASNWPYNPGDKLVTYHLFHHHGDAFMTIYSEVPQALAVEHDPVLFLGLGAVRMQAPAGALIGLTVNGEIIGSAVASGLPQDVPVVPQEYPGELRITVTKANYYRYDHRIPIVPPEGAYLVFDACSVNDSQGDADSCMDAGESVGLMLTLENVGVDPTSGVFASLATVDPHVTISTPDQAYPDIPAGGVGTCVEPYAVQIAGNAPDGQVVRFTLSAHSNEGDWDSAFSLAVQAPVLASGGLLIDDSAPLGDGDGVADPGEGFYLQLWTSNTGHSIARDLTASLSSVHPGVTILDGEGSCISVPIGGQGLLSAFQVELSPSLPTPTTLAFQVHLSAPTGYATDLSYELSVGAWVDDAEGDRGWSFSAADDNASSGRWVRGEPVGTTYNSQQCQPEYDHTADPAQNCFVTGNGSVGGAAGEADVDGGKTTLLSPVFDLGTAVSATVEYWRWYTNSLGNNPGQDYWDVDVTSDGTNWVSLEHTLESANAWTRYSYDLGAFVPLTNQTRLRFVARDDSPGSLVEAAIDDFSLTAIKRPAVDAPDGAIALRSGIVSCNPNPFNPRTTILFRTVGKGPAELCIYDVAGRRVKSLVDGPIDAGLHTRAFDGRDDAGRPLPSGIYFIHLNTADVLDVRQMTLLK